MEVTSDILDDNLKKLLTSAMNYTGEERSIAAILYSDGYVTLQSTNMGDVCLITPSGRAFIKQGGYVGAELTKKKGEEKVLLLKAQEIEMQRIVSEKLMEKDHEFQARQNKANRKNNIISGLIAAIVSAIVTLVMQVL